MKKKRASSSQPVVELVGRSEEQALISACIRTRRNVLIEGPVGVGKTHLALALCESLGRPVFRVDGDGRYSEQKLSGWFDPPLVLRKGYSLASFVSGPLVEAMKSGGVLFINELNRLPEGVQNVLLPAIDERKIMVPKLGVVHAHPDFTVIATQNPKEFVATSHLSEAILDRFELVVLDYQSESEEQAIVARTVSKTDLVKAAVRLVRFTRSHERIKRGASVRAAQAVAELSQALAETLTPREAFFRAALLALPTRIELERDVDSEASPPEELKKLVQELAQEAWSGAFEQGIEKKKS